MRVLVTGGAGYIGSHTVLSLAAAGHEPVVADNFCNSKPEVMNRLRELAGGEVELHRLDLCDGQATDRLFKDGGFDAVIHFAGLKAVGESVQKPLEYFSNNLGSTLNVLESMRKYGVKNFVFSSSATVYGSPETVPVTEDFPLSVTNPYGRTKLMIEDMLRDICRADPELNVALLRYFNPIGAHPSGRIGEDPFDVPNNLMPYVAQVAVGRRERLSVFGDDYDTPDGTGVRDYIHVVDLADGHVAALKKLSENCGLVTYNLGTGRGYSVLELVAAFSRACGHDIPYVIAPRRAGDVAELWSDPSKAKAELGWSAKLTLDDMCRDSWNWQSNNPNGYGE